MTPRNSPVLATLVLLFCILALSPLSRAQSPEAGPAAGRFEVFAGYSFLSNSFNGHSSATSHQPLNGWDAAVALPLREHLSLKMDASGYYGTSLGSPQRPIFVLAGPQYKLRLGAETAFIEGLVGFGHLNSDWWGGSSPGTTNSFAADAGGGLDTPLGPRLALRVQGDFQYSNFTIPDDQIHNLPNYFARISTGFLWRW